MSRHNWIAADLDGTLLSRDFAAPDAIPATWRTTPEGERVPSSWMHAATHAVLTALRTSFAVVPVTARDFDSYSRVAIPEVPFQGAVLANGAILLKPDGEPDEEWNAHMGAQLGETVAELEALCTRIEKASAGAARPRLVASGTSHPAYLVAKAEETWWQSDDGVHMLKTLEVRQCQASLLKNELQVLPTCVSKRAGVAAFQARYQGGTPPALGLGDMLPDLGFMRDATFLVIPSGSKLDQSLPLL
jgi:hypothetical protein